LEDPDAQSCGHCYREAFHAGQHGRRERRQQDDGPADHAEVGAENRHGEDRRDAGQPRSQHPRDEGQPPHRDAEQQGPLVGVGGRPHGDAEVAAREEPRQTEQHHGHGDHHEHVVTPKHDGADVETGVEGCLEGVDRLEVLADEGGDPDLGRPQDLEDADGGDSQDETRRVEEAPDHDQIEQGPGAQGDGDAHRYGEEVALVPAAHHHLGHGCGQTADLDLGEVDDPARAVDEDKAHGRERVETSEHESQQDHAEGQSRRQERAGDHPRHEDDDGDKAGAAEACARRVAQPGGERRAFRRHWPKQWTWVWAGPYADGSSNGKYLPPSPGTHAPFTPSKSAGRFGSQ
jgi:hypothetical protein